MRLVDADALKEDCRMANDCKDCKTYVRDCEYDRIYAKMDFCGWIDDAPTVDAVPVVHGRWTDKDGGIATCSVCGDRWGGMECYEILPELRGKDGWWNERNG